MKRLPMGSPIGSGTGISIFFCSISRGGRVLYSHGGEGDPEALAAAAAESAPPFHSRYCHTVGNRTFAYLIDEDGHSYFAVADSASAGVLCFLELMRDGFRRASRNGVHDELISVIRRLIASLGTISRPPPLGTAVDASPTKSMTAASEAPLLARGSGDGNVKEGGAGDMWIEVPAVPAGMTALQKSFSSRNWMQQNGHGRRLWWWHVKIVIAVDVLICLVLFGIWLAICNGFQCIA